MRPRRGRGPVLEDGGRARVDEKRSCADTRRIKARFRARRRREAASKNYDEYPLPVRYFDAMLKGGSVLALGRLEGST